MDLTSWEAASDLMASWNGSGQIGVSRANIPNTREAVKKYLADAQARNLKPESVRKIHDVVERRLLEFCTQHGWRTLRQLDVDAVREFRNELVQHYAPNSARKRLEYVRAFFRFCHQTGWIDANPAATVKPPQADTAPTLPFDKRHVAAMLSVADAFNPRGNFGAGIHQAFVRRTARSDGDPAP